MLDAEVQPSVDELFEALVRRDPLSNLPDPFLTNVFRSTPHLPCVAYLPVGPGALFGVSILPRQ